jgi:putative hydrolase of the HAD superfamily
MSSQKAYHEILRRHSRRLPVEPTGTRPQLLPLPDVRAVLFGVYGTLFISAAGGVGSAADQEDAQAFDAAFRATGFKEGLNAARGAECFRATLRAHREHARQRGADYPEVNIVEVWRDCLLEMTRCHWLDAVSIRFDLKQLAIEYEARVNPVWPMPGLVETLAQLKAAGMLLGIVSNAQFFTADLFRGLLGKTADQLGFDPQLQFFSYRYMRAKPSERLYQLVAKTLATRGVAPSHTVHVGSDLRDDVLGAGRVGFRTVLFAGDRRGLHERRDDPHAQGATPDAIVTDLQSTCACLLPSRPTA